MATSRVIGRISDSFEIEKQLSPTAEVLSCEAGMTHFLTIESIQNALRAKAVVVQEFIEGAADWRN